MRRFLFYTLLVIWGLLAASPAVLGQDMDFKTGSEGDIRYMTGGVSKGERAEMEKRSNDYNLKIILAAKSGAYLANIPVTICEDGGEPVLMSTRADGPWLYVRLPEGRYTIKAVHEGREKKKTVQVDQGLKLIIFHWAT